MHSLLTTTIRVSNRVDLDFTFILAFQMAEQIIDRPWEHEQSLLIALGAMPVGISWATLSDQRIVYMNRKFTEIFGYVLGDFEFISDWIARYPAALDRSMAHQGWGRYFEAPDGRDFPIDPMELSILCKDGTLKTILHSGIILPQAGWALATFIDITERKRDEILIREAEKRANENEAIYRTLLDHSQEMIVLSSFDGLQRHVSPAVLQITGWTPDEYLSKSISEIMYPADLEATIQGIQEVAKGGPSKAYRHRIMHKDGEYRWVEALVQSYSDPASAQPIGYVATIRNIGEQKRQEDLLASENRQLSEYATQDELTGISNRRVFNRALEQEVRRQTRSTRALALLMLDVDKFKEYNDYYGHLAGDECLKQIAKAMKQSLHRRSDMVARFGGEEFVILLPTTDRKGAEHIARIILEAVRSLSIPHIHGPAGIITVSIGIACWPAQRAIDPLRLQQQADMALYRAKGMGRNTYCMIECDAAIAAVVSVPGAST